MSTFNKLRFTAVASLAAASIVVLAGCERILEPEGVEPTPVATQPITDPTGQTPDPVLSPEPEESATPAPAPSETPSPGPEASPSATPSPEASPTPTPEPSPTMEAEPAFYYYPPGHLEDGSGTGHEGDVVFVPDMVFPIKDAPAYPQSQVYRFGGGMIGGDQCDARNFEYPWRDNYCEKRTRENGTPYCPVNRVHLGQDIRVGTPAGCRAERSASPADRKRYAVVAAEDGLISNVGKYTVNVRAGGRIYRYMHMNMQALEVELGQAVKAGDVLGYVSNDFAGTPTTLHLHFEIKHNTREAGWTWAPPFTSLVAAYERREGGKGEMITQGSEEGGNVAVASE